MVNIKSVLLLLCLFLISTTPAFGAVDIDKLEGRLEEAKDVFEEVMEMPDKGIPVDLLEKCSAVAIFPSVIKGGFILGGRYGTGVVLYRDKDTGEWSAPAFFLIGGGSWGLQIGAQSIDLVLVFMGERGVKGLLKSNFAIGGDVAVAAGPVGRDAAADTDLMLKGGIFTYSRTKGLFAGIALKGAVISAQDKSNQVYYEDDEATAKNIFFEQKFEPTAEGQELIDLINEYIE